MASGTAQRLREDLRSGRFDGGSLPSMRRLAELYGCGVGSIHRALKTMQGEGVLPEDATHRRRHTGLPAAAQPNRVIGAVVLPHGEAEALERIKWQWLTAGWFFVVYHSRDDLQSPEAERRFLTRALEQNFAAVIIAATPLRPVNTGLFRQMRRAGMKVLHLIPYQADMSGENFIMPDYRAAARFSAGLAVRRGFRRILYCNAQPDAPSRELQRLGLREAAGLLGLPAPEEVIVPDSGRIPDAALRKRTPDTAVLCAECDLAQRWLARDAAAPVISMANLAPESGAAAGYRFDWEEQIRRAVAYAADPAIGAEQPFQHHLTPELYLPEQPDNPFQPAVNRKEASR